MEIKRKSKLCFLLSDTIWEIIKTVRRSITSRWVLDICKTRTGDGQNADRTTDTTTTVVANRARPLLYGLMKEQQNVSLCFKTGILQSQHSCGPKSVLPLLLSPFPGSNQSSSSGPCASCAWCFFPFRFFSPLCGLGLFKYSKGVKWWWTPHGPAIFPFAVKATFVIDV